MSRITKLAATIGAVSLVAGFTVTAAQSEPVNYPISFPTGSVALHAADMQTIHGVAAMMARDPSCTIMVLGKTDTVGSAAYNERLSQRRAEVVYHALVDTYKVPASRVHQEYSNARHASLSLRLRRRVPGLDANIRRLHIHCQLVGNRRITSQVTAIADCSETLLTAGCSL